MCHDRQLLLGTLSTSIPAKVDAWLSLTSSHPISAAKLLRHYSLRGECANEAVHRWLRPASSRVGDTQRRRGCLVNVALSLASGVGTDHESLFPTSPLLRVLPFPPCSSFLFFGSCSPLCALHTPLHPNATLHAYRQSTSIFALDSDQVVFPSSLPAFDLPKHEPQPEFASRQYQPHPDMDLEDILLDLRQVVGCNGLRNLTDLGKMRQKTLEKRLRAAQRDLHPLRLAFICALWLSDQAKRIGGNEREDAVEKCSILLAEMNCSRSQMLAAWKECTVHALREGHVRAESREQTTRQMNAVKDDIMRLFPNSSSLRAQSPPSEIQKTLSSCPVDSIPLASAAFIHSQNTCLEAGSIPSVE